MRTNQPWTEAMILQLRELWAEGQTASKIAEAIGVSRNAIIGKADRLKLSGRKSGFKRGTLRARRPKKAPEKTPEFVPVLTTPVTAAKPHKPKKRLPEPTKSELRRMFEQAWAQTKP